MLLFLFEGDSPFSGSLGKTALFGCGTSCAYFLCKETTLTTTICCINPRSVKNKTLSFCDYIISNDFDLVAVTETWLGTSIGKACISELLPCGYQFKHVPRSGGRRGGGVALIFRASC